MRYFLALAEEAEPRFGGAEQAGWLKRLEEEHDNLRATLKWIETSEQTELGLRLAGSLWWFWYLCGYAREGREHLERALALPGGNKETTARAEVLRSAGVMAGDQGDVILERSLTEESLAMFQELGNKEGVGFVLLNLGFMAGEQGDYTSARSMRRAWRYFASWETSGVWPSRFTTWGFWLACRKTTPWDSRSLRKA